MNLINSIDCLKGITLNSQLVDLLSILDEQSLSIEEQDKRITEYIEKLQETVIGTTNAEKNGKRVLFILDSIINNNTDIPQQQKEIVKQLYISNIRDFSICDTPKMKEILAQNGISPDVQDSLMKDLKNSDYRAKEGILELTPDLVRKLYEHIFKDGKNTYNRITFDEAGKYSLYMALDGETVCHERLDKMVEFCERHGMKSKINTFMFYCDFPKMYEASLDAKIKSGEITEEDKKAALKQSLLKYVTDIGKRYGDRIDNVDIFNELIYDPDMREVQNFGRQSDVFKEEDTYHPRVEGWQKYFSIEDLCEIALEARKLMPNAAFTYNDMNWVNSEKRAQIIQIVKQIQEIEKKYRAEGKLSATDRGLIDFIGLEAHLTTGDTIEDIEQTVADIERELKLPIEVTELDVARVGDNPLSNEEIIKQSKIVEKFIELVKDGRINYLTVWSTSDRMSFMNEKCGKNVYASVILDENMDEKEFFRTRDHDIQKFNYHTHTALCGHASGEIHEYIENAIKGGITKLGFSDHTPNVMGRDNPTAAMTLEQFKKDYVPVIEDLRKKYSDKIDIKIGLEAEYYGDEGEQHPTVKKFREETEHKLDYMILGQHAVLARDDNGKIKFPLKSSDMCSAKYPLDYAMTVVEAIQSGKFAYVAHPDIYLQSRDKVPDSEKDKYMKNAEYAAKMICEAASRCKIPLEVNLGNISAVEAGMKSKLRDGAYAYPVPDFWKYAQEYGCDVLIGTDAHTPEALKDKRSEMIAKELLENNGIQLNYLETFEPLGIGKETSRMFKAQSQVTSEAKKEALLRSCKIDTQLDVEAQEVIINALKKEDPDDPDPAN